MYGQLMLTVLEDGILVVGSETCIRLIGIEYRITGKVRVDVHV
jgi:hypothetical protein